MPRTASYTYKNTTLQEYWDLICSEKFVKALSEVLASTAQFTKTTHTQCTENPGCVRREDEIRYYANTGRMLRGIPKIGNAFELRETRTLRAPIISSEELTYNAYQTISQSLADKSGIEIKGTIRTIQRGPDLVCEYIFDVSGPFLMRGICVLIEKAVIGKQTTVFDFTKRWLNDVRCKKRPQPPPWYVSAADPVPGGATQARSPAAPLNRPFAATHPSSPRRFSSPGAPASPCSQSGFPAVLPPGFQSNYGFRPGPSGSGSLLPPMLHSLLIAAVTAIDSALRNPGQPALHGLRAASGLVVTAVEATATLAQRMYGTARTWCWWGGSSPQVPSLVGQQPVRRCSSTESRGSASTAPVPPPSDSRSPNPGDSTRDFQSLPSPGSPGHEKPPMSQDPASPSHTRSQRTAEEEAAMERASNCGCGVYWRWRRS